MKSAQEDQSEKLYYSIKEVEKLLDIPASTLRFWGKQFTEIEPRKNGKGDRLYRKEDISLIRTIHHLIKEKGYTIEGAKKALKDKQNEPNTFKIIEKLESIQFFLRELRKKL